jgi:predicted patatin/cPLA2 family phospholipase
MPRLDEQVLLPDTTNPLIERLLLKTYLLEQGDPAHESIRPALIVHGGGMRGVYSTGVTAKFEDLGLSDTFDNAIGVSAGACAVAYFLSRQASRGPSVYYDDLTNKDFINPFRLRGIMDIGYLENIFKNVKPLDQDVVRKSRTDMYIGLTDSASGSGSYLNVTKKPEIDLARALVTSSAIPGVVKPQIPIDGTVYSDGSTGCTNTIDFAIDELNATDILVVTNRPLTDRSKTSTIGNFFSRIILRNYSREFQDSHIYRYSNHNLLPDKKYLDTINIGVLSPDRSYVGPLCKDSRKLRALADYAIKQTTEIFEQ